MSHIHFGQREAQSVLKYQGRRGYFLIEKNNTIALLLQVQSKGFFFHSSFCSMSSPHPTAQSAHCPLTDEGPVGAQENSHRSTTATVPFPSFFSTPRGGEGTVAAAQQLPQQPEATAAAAAEITEKKHLSESRREYNGHLPFAH